MKTPVENLTNSEIDLTDYDVSWSGSIRKDLGRAYILGIDPGSVNCGLSLVSLDRERKDDLKIHYSAVMTSPVKGLILDPRGSAKDFLEELKKWIVPFAKSYSVDGVVAERFIARGMRKGNTGEEIAIMLGLLTSTCLAQNIPLKLITAATWKNRLNREFSENQRQNMLDKKWWVQDLSEFYKETRVAPHQVDAALIGAYGLQLGLRMIPPPGSGGKKLKVGDGPVLPWSVKWLSKVMERTSLTRIVERRKIVFDGTKPCSE